MPDTLPARRPLWRAAFLLAGALILTGGPRHPSGTMAEMLGDPNWVPCHALVLAGFVALLGGLVLLRRGGTLPAHTAWWARVATWATVGQTVEMVLHTAAAVDHAHLVAGEPTPVLSTHLALATVAYPAFGAAVAGLVVAGARDRTLGSTWIAWLGVLGAAAHGVAPPLLALGIGGPVRRLFWGLAVLALWLALAALWPRGARRRAPLSDATASTIA